MMLTRRVRSKALSKDREVQHGDAEGKIQEDGSWTAGRLLLGCLAFRFFNALLLQTFFNPDEYWQSVEVAHRIVFGYGHLTWEWHRGLRGYLHPLLFAGLYKLIALSNLDTQWLVVKAPRLLQAVFAAAGDYYLFKLARHYWGEQTARWAIFCHISNWFSFFCMVRTFSNSLETVLTIAGLYFWHSDMQCRPLTARQVALVLAALACSIRPTSAIIWFYVGIVGLIQTKNKMCLLLEVLVIGATTLGATCLLDWWMYERWTFVPLNFLKFNFLSSGGDYYGTHPWHWYFSQGFPAMVFTQLPLSIVGIWWSKQWHLAGLMMWVLSMYSVLGHKEFRFVLPILPLGVTFAGYALSCMQQQSYINQPVNQTSESDAKRKPRRKAFWFHVSIVALLLTNIPMALYMSTIHQRGSEAVMHYLSNEAGKGDMKSVMFLMPCHSTPFYSFLHTRIPMRFLDCTPREDVGYVDESDRFLSEPKNFLLKMFQSPEELPTHMVLFDSLEDDISSFLQENGYRLATKIFHAHFAVDHGLQKYILVYHRGGLTS